MKNKFRGKIIHRSLLFTAGHNLKYINKSFQTQADAIVFDLEDAVPENKKTEAREILRDFLSRPLPDNRSVYVRINPLDSGYTILDIDAVASPYLDGFVYPMAYSARDLIVFDAQLSLKEKMLGLPQYFFQVIVLIETPESVIKINEIVSASRRIIGLLFGSEDFLAEQEGSHGENGVGIQVPRHLIAMAAKAHNVMAIDTPYVQVGDFEGLKRHISQAKILGFDGMLIMSPKELEIANSMYTPSDEEIDRASEIVRLHEKAEQENKGIVIYNGIFVSPPTLKAAKKTMAKFNAIKDYLNFFQNNK